MSVIEIRKDPGPRDLRIFGLSITVLFAVLGGIVYWRTGSVRIPAVIWAAGGLVSVLYHAIPGLRKPIYVGWMYAVYPIGWTISHLLLVTVFYLVLTPIGLVLRILGRDPLERGFDRSEATYWVERRPVEKRSRYFDQF